MGMKRGLPQTEFKKTVRGGNVDLSGEEQRTGKKLHDKGLHNSYSSSVIITVVKSWRVRWEGYVVRTPETRIAYKILVEKTCRREVSLGI
jgi:hypothetical protein